jgi:hypothetical protein
MPRKNKGSIAAEAHELQTVSSRQIGGVNGRLEKRKGQMGLGPACHERLQDGFRPRRRRRRPSRAVWPGIRPSSRRPSGRALLLLVVRRTAPNTAHPVGAIWRRHCLIDVKMQNASIEIVADMRRKGENHAYEMGAAPRCLAPRMDRSAKWRLEWLGWRTKNSQCAGTLSRGSDNRCSLDCVGPLCRWLATRFWLPLVPRDWRQHFFRYGRCWTRGKLGYNDRHRLSVRNGWTP